LGEYVMEYDVAVCLEVPHRIWDRARANRQVTRGPSEHCPILPPTGCGYNRRLDSTGRLISTLGSTRGWPRNPQLGIELPVCPVIGSVEIQLADVSRAASWDRNARAVAGGTALWYPRPLICLTSVRRWRMRRSVTITHPTVGRDNVTTGPPGSAEAGPPMAPGTGAPTPGGHNTRSALCSWLVPALPLST
jgi:hypothetical protein